MDISLFTRYAAETAMVIPAAVLALLPVRNSLRFGKRKTYLAMAVLLLLFIPLSALLCTAFKLASNAVIFAGMGVFFIIYAVCVRYSIAKKLFCFFHGAALAGFCTMFTAYLGAPFDIGTVGLFSLKWGLIALASSAVMTLLFLRDSLCRLHDLLENESMDKLWKLFAVAPILIMLLSIWAMPIDYQNVLAGRVRIISLLLFPLFPLVYHLIIHLLWWTAEHITRETELKRQNDLLQIEEKRYNELRYYTEQASVIRHDFRHHLSVIIELLNMDKTAEARQYIEQFIDAGDADHKPFCKNREIDAIAAHYDKLARKSGIRIRWILKIGETLPFRGADLCAIMGNLLENAVNAVQELPETQRKIDITMEMRTNQMLALFIRNPYQNEIVYDKKGMPRSTKAGHGIGLRSVAGLVKSYHGNLQIAAHDNLFDVSIIMFANGKQE